LEKEGKKYKALGGILLGILGGGLFNKEGRYYYRVGGGYFTFLGPLP